MLLRTIAFSLLLSGGIAATAPAAIADDRAVPPTAAAIQLSFAPIVKKAAPAVVNIYASRTIEMSSSPFFGDPFFQRFFGGGDFGPPQKRVQQSLGSGVFVDPSGIVVTNNHVIANADEIKVALSDRREFDCDVVLKDERTDLAVLKLRNAKGPFPILNFGDSDQHQVGDLVLAIGDPFGVGQTVTSGIVSALARTQVGVSDYQFFIQTDASINPGNSGGALIDMNGNLVGINSAIYSRTGDSSGIGFAIPVNMVRVIVESAKTGNKVRLPWVGASFQEVTPDVAESLGLARPVGALVADLTEQSPAWRSGLKTGDVVTSIDGIAIDDPAALNYRLATKGIGAQAKLIIVRRGKEYSVTLPLEAAPESVPRDQVAITGQSPFAGATVVNLSPAVAEEMSYRGDPKGVIISAVAPGSIADQAGFRPGDVVVNVNGTAIDTTERLKRVAGTDTRTWQLVIERDGRTIRSVLRG